MDESFDLDFILKNSDSQIQEFVSALKKENFKLKKQIAKLEAEKVSLRSEIELLTEENAQRIEHNKNFQSLSGKELQKYMDDRLRIRMKLNKKK